MADWGLYAALQGKDNWQQKRQDKMMNLAIAEKREAKAEAKLQESMKMESEINTYFDELAKMDVLAEDQERVKQVEKNARKNVIAGIAKANGDLKKYMVSGGISALSEYKNSVLQSQEVKQAMMNKTNLGLYLQNAQKGNLRHKFVDVELPVYDENGEQAVDELGNPMVKTEKMKFEDQMKLFKAGKLNKLNYNGAENRINVGIEDFSKLYKNPANPYQADNYVTESDIFKKAMSKGASEEYARDLAKRYGQMHREGGQAWRWNAGDPMDLMIKQQKIANMRAAKSRADERFTKTAILNSLVPDLKNLQIGEEKPMSFKQKEMWGKQFGFNYVNPNDDDPGGLRAPKGFIVKDAHDPSKQYDLGRAVDIKFDKYVSIDENQSARDGMTGFNRNNQEEANKQFPVKPGRYVMVSATYDEGGTILGDLLGGKSGNEGTPFSDSRWDSNVDNAVRHNWVENGDGSYTGQVLIPVEQLISDDDFIMDLNKMIGVNANAHYTGGSVTNEMQNATAQGYIREIMETTGVSAEEAGLMLQEYGFDPDQL